MLAFSALYRRTVMVRFSFGLFSAAYLGCKPPYFGFITFSLLKSKVESWAFAWLARMLAEKLA